MKNSHLLIAIYYFFTATWSSAELFLGWHVGMRWIASLLIGMAPTLWLLIDSRKRGIGIPHVIQPVLILWPLVVPLYAIVTRKKRGLWKVFAHCVVTIILTILFSVGTILVFWGPRAFLG